MATSSKAKKKNRRLASGRKRARQDVKLNAANTSLRSKFRTVVKNVQKAVAAGDKAKATELCPRPRRASIDSVADKGIFHKNKAARHKSRLSAKVKALRHRRRLNASGSLEASRSRRLHRARCRSERRRTVLRLRQRLVGQQAGFDHLQVVVAREVHARSPRPSARCSRRSPR